MIIHPEFDPTTKTWFVSIHGTNYEAESIPKLIDKTPPGIHRTLIVDDYYPIGTRMPPIDYGPHKIEDFMVRPSLDALRAAGRRGAVTFGKGVLSQGRTEPRLMGGAESSVQTASIAPPRPKKRYQPRPELAAGRSTKGILPEEREKLNNQILDMWAEGKTSHEIAEKLDLKINYIGCNVIPTARVRGDKRAQHRTDQKYIYKK